MADEAIQHYGVKGMKWGDNKTVEELQAEVAALTALANKPPRNASEAAADVWTKKNLPGASPVRKQGARELFTVMEKNKNEPAAKQKAAMNAVGAKYDALLATEKRASQPRRTPGGKQLN